jgi:prophage regulatory protein
MSRDHPTESTEPQPPAPGRLIRLPGTLALVGLQRSAWLDLVRKRKAPQPVKIGRATLWVESEVQAFIAERIRESRGAQR